VTIDPGHNGGNVAAPGIIDQLVWNGRALETCDTTGTATDVGYAEAQFNWNVARYLRTDLEGEGADVLLTRSSNTGVGPCVTQRAAIANAFGSDAAVSIHADEGPPYGRGFAVLEPVADGVNGLFALRRGSVGRPRRFDPRRHRGERRRTRQHL
jgi:N-acetylmuramoyl-L-alanine amidase